MSLKVSIKDKNTLVLNEDGKIGDKIDLRDIQNVDLSAIEEKIRSSKDEVYERMLKEERNKYNLEKEKDILEATKQLDKKIIELENALEAKNKVEAANIKLKEKEVEEKYKSEILKLQQDLELSKKDSELAKMKLSEEHSKEILKLNEEISILRNSKAAFGSKMTGENLEIYCNNIYLEASQNGFYNCKWYKDTKNVKDEGDIKGTKADYIFEVYATKECKPEELLTNVCLEMKDENPDSKTKQTNESFYKQLDKNREKKNCKYALLVSNLEMDSLNDLPIRKIKDYEDMYMVRPGYMMTFLNMITSLTMRFRDLILKDYENQESIKKQLEFMEEFEKIKLTYLDKPLTQLENRVTEIKKQAGYIVTAGNKINDECENITKMYIKSIEDKLETFTVQLGRSYKRLNK